MTTPPDTGLGHPISQSADSIDRVVRLAPKWAVCALGACSLLVVSIIIWAITGTVTSSVSVSGLYLEAGALRVQTTKDATVDRVLVTLGESVTTGQDVVSLEGGGFLTSPQSGMVTSILVSAGSIMIAGKIALRVTDLSQLDTVVALVPAGMTGTAAVGLPVRMSVSSAPSGQYGYLLGTVTEISSDPYTTAEVSEKLGLQQEVVASLLGSEPGFLAIVTLDSEPSTVSQYRWSIGQGPPFPITQGVPIAVEIDVSEQRPIQVVFSG
ncbi:HlyD family efflux transporter periplasmic adaptor subunit [Nakamurella sp. PAMC28650]|uniref:HlyD family efflux transporter periplasmic adaptor subunit n=1 Tax=Nakamurella sp. PAMC28650 TaxID=2762325 RepID=UPI00164E0F3E|nr:HlyD family efflux transporter periplasmic adaptor subunit [Nakamurella sp. PAMC28650]QNK82123.1 HlyD family efflux transporter periplasmic adaptor subunit [Nakamurella sp. PAMC28650]